MRVIVNRNHARHAPPFECENGLPTIAHESPGRVEAIRVALEARGGYSFEEAPSLPLEALARVHDPGYLDFLLQTSDHLQQARGSEARFTIPSVFPFGHLPLRYRGNVHAGLHCFDTYTAITPGTYDAALSSASGAWHAAGILAQGNERSIYVLTRPPGHHAERSRCGGYCFLNNAAIASQCFSEKGPVAVLDLDVHHGNGTQHLFYERSDVFVVSIHGDPDHLFPHFSGYPDETGTGQGLGFNRNFPLPLGTGVGDYRPALEAALEAIARFRPTFLVVSFGADAHEADPIGEFRLPTEYFAEMGRQVRQLAEQLAAPVLVVQEGGYNLEVIGECAARFLGAIGEPN